MKPIIAMANLLKNLAFQNNLVVVVFGLSLSACTGLTYSSHFDCPMGEGAGCASISRVNKMIDRQEIDLGHDDTPSGNGGCARQIESPSTAFGNQVYVYYGPDQLSRLIPTDGLDTPTARGPTLDQEGN